MIQAAYKDKTLVVDILVKAFDSNKSVNYVIKQDSKREKRIRRLMEYSFEVCWEAGEIYITSDKKGVALLLLPHKKKVSLKGIWQVLTLALFSVGISKVFRVSTREAKIKKIHPKKFLYFWYLGVEPQHQGKGIGSSLLQDIINLSNKDKLPIYLETSTEKNIPLYERFKFERYQELNFNHTLYMYRKQPQ